MSHQRLGRFKGIALLPEGLVENPADFPNARLLPGQLLKQGVADDLAAVLFHHRPGDGVGDKVIQPFPAVRPDVGRLAVAHHRFI